MISTIVKAEFELSSAGTRMLNIEKKENVNAAFVVGHLLYDIF